MPVVRKSLGQAALAATTLTDLYAVPIGTSTVVSSITVANRGGATTFRLSHARAAAADATQQYIAYDMALAANDTKIFALGMCMAAADVLRAYAAAATVSVNVWGEETSS